MKCPGKSNKTKGRSAGCLNLERINKGVTAKGQGFPFMVIKMNILNTTKLYHLHGSMIQHVSYISINL